MTHFLSTFPVFLALAFAGQATAQRLLLDVTGIASGSEFGFSLAAIADIDQDGRRDLVVGAPGTSSGVMVDCGRGHVISARTGAVLASTGLGVPTTRLGDRVVGLGDVSGDGQPDFVLAAPRASVFGLLQGNVRAFRHDGTMLWSAFGENYSEFGTGICAVHDLFGNGRDDLMIGAPHNSNVHPFGRVQPFNATSGLDVGQFAGGDSTLFGHAIVNLGDVDGDGADDIAVSEPDFTYVSYGGGRITVLRSNHLGSSAFVWDQYTIFAAGDHAGRAMGVAGDLDGDGRNDLMVATQSGRVYLLSGATGSVIGSVVDAYGSFGASLCGLGDQNGDGRPEFAVGAPTYNLGQGRVYVFDGATRSLLWYVQGNAQSAFGQSIANAGDQDDDGRDDLAVGAPMQAQLGGVPGRVAIFGTTIPATSSVYGTACGGSQGQLQAIALGTPLPGQSIGIRVYNLPPQSVGLTCIGLSRTQSAFGALPLDLGVIGVPGCWLLQSLESTTAFATGSSQYLNLTVNLPNWPALAGIQLFFQAVMLDASHAGGLTTSNGAAFTIGNQ